jgi:hypothetical protein
MRHFYNELLVINKIGKYLPASTWKSGYRCNSYQHFRTCLLNRILCLGATRCVRPSFFFTRGSATGQAGSCLFHTAEIRVQSPVISHEIRGGRSGTEAGWTEWYWSRVFS